MQCSKQRRRAWNLWDQGWAELVLQEQLGRSRAAPRATAQTRCEGDQTPVRERGENTHHVLQGAPPNYCLPFGKLPWQSCLSASLTPSFRIYLLICKCFSMLPSLARICADFSAERSCRARCLCNPFPGKRAGIRSSDGDCES